jgi:2-polyprenyl-3-methyl-5-hydroxy-6-metoxy-1,4-benzoquinol methylase
MLGTFGTTGPAGEEWFREFGGTEALWWFVIYPRIHRFLPAPTVLEIAPGLGRWTKFLKAQCQSMTAVDLSERCIEHCKRRYASDIVFQVNEGELLELCGQFHRFCI